MSSDLAQAEEMIRRCREFRDAGKVEAVLRSEIDSRLRLVFPSAEDEKWINHYTSGTEAHTKVGQKGGGAANRFIDNLIGATTIEYEADLRIRAKHDEGFSQVRDHAAGLIRMGIPISQVRGILSDTVDWFAYDAVLKTSIDPAHCIADDIDLVLVDKLTLPKADALSAKRLTTFLRKHLAREQSRPLQADLLTFDLGLDSNTYRRSVTPLLRLVKDGRVSDPGIALATELWSEFVDYLEGDKGAFRAFAFADEVYLLVISRLLSANVLAGKALLSDDNELTEILDGTHFRAHYQLDNMVELDYFGWLIEPKHCADLIPIAKEIQRDLFAYDFSWRPEEDLFGRLMAQLARRSQRQLLGQEWTPAWLAHLLAESCLNNLPEGEVPRIVDMCCGSGTILTEILKEARKRGFTGIHALHDVATGFDIDPLAVSLSKTTWVVTLADEIKAAGSPIIIPIYHADSLFAVTPVTSLLPFLEDEGTIDVALDGKVIQLPRPLVQPIYRDLFDRIVDWSYDEARSAQAAGIVHEISEEEVTHFIENVTLATTGKNLDEELKASLIPAIVALVNRMAELAVAGRNGIWAFILRNTYRPGLLAGQFNGLVSNPPWLAMSGLADNPYRAVLTGRAKLYGIHPPGQSFLHLELGTTHLLHAVDRYLKPGAAVACLVPGTVFNGHHHEKLRRQQFLSSERRVPFEIAEIWQVAPGTFKYPGAAIIGHKRTSSAGLNKEPVGFLALSRGLEEAEFSTRTIGTKRTAWVLEKEGEPFVGGGMTELPQQGADFMPRTAVCIEIKSDHNAELHVDTPHTGSPWAFTVKAAKELKYERFPGHVAPCFIYRIAQSENLLPYVLGKHCAPIAIPAKRDSNGQWHIYDEVEVRRMGYTQSARRFKAINDKLATIGKGKSLQERIDERGKLKKQVFGSDGILILAGAGGKHICAACLPVSEAQNLVIDQTIYWKIVKPEEKAWFFVALLNSQAMTEAIMPFNPKGAFGERHIHALPYRLMPTFDSNNEDHMRIAMLARVISKIAASTFAKHSYLNDPSKALHVRRTKMRAQLMATSEVQELEVLCAATLGTSIYTEDEE